MREYRPFKAWTDYPVTQLGDVAGHIAPVRECDVVAYDNDKNVTIMVEGVTMEIKAGYCYMEKGREGTVPALNRRILSQLTPRPQYPDEWWVKNVCKIGQDVKCCRYLTMGSNGWSCEKLVPANKLHFDRRAAKGDMRARADNCEGLGSK